MSNREKKETCCGSQSPSFPGPCNVGSRHGEMTVLTQLFGRHRFGRHAYLRPSCLGLLGMLAIAATLCVLLTPSLSAFDARLTWDRTVTSSLGPHRHQPPPQHNSGEETAVVAQPQLPTMSYAPKSARPLARLPVPLIAHLSAEHAPPPLHAAGDGTETNDRPKTRRLVFVGDVHGHLHALRALLDKIHFNHKHGDQLVLLGDIVAKGPDSAGVVDLAMHIGANGVRGNHENKVLLAHKALQRERRRKKKKQRKKKLHPAADQDVISSSSDASDYHVTDLDGEDDNDDDNDDGDNVTIDTHADHARAVARSLSPKQLKWLASLPLILRINTTSIPGVPPSPTGKPPSHPWDSTEILVVHAGLVPSLALEMQDPWAVMNMRTLLYPAPRYPSSGEEEEEIPAIPSETRAGEPWSRAWNRWQNVKVSNPTARTVVIYGHDARAGLQAEVDVRIRPHPAERKNEKTRKEEEIGMEVYVAEDEDDDTDAETETDEEETDMAKRVGNLTLGDDTLNLHLTQPDGNIHTDCKKKKDKTGKKKKQKPTRGIRYAFGLDSGCGHGRQLSALVLEAVGEDGTLMHRIEQADCGEVENELRTRL